jgi:hypothetical protein
MARKPTRAEVAGEYAAFERGRPAGWVPCHNHVLHPHPKWRHGLKGFRAFYAPRADGYAECPCGWRPELGVHYAIPQHVAHYSSPNFDPAADFRRATKGWPTITKIALAARRATAKRRG